MSEIVKTEMLFDQDAKTIRLHNVEDFREAAKALGFDAKEKGRPALKPFAETLLLGNWTIQPTEFFSNSTALGIKVPRVAKDKAAETVWNVSYRKVHANGGTGPIQTATVTMADVRKHTGEKAGRIGPKRIMIALAAKLETTLDKLTTAGHTFASSQSDDITTAMLAGTVSEVDQTPTVPVQVGTEDTSTGDEVHATVEQINAAMTAGEAAAENDSETRAAVLQNA